VSDRKDRRDERGGDRRDDRRGGRRGQRGGQPQRLIINVQLQGSTNKLTNSNKKYNKQCYSRKEQNTENHRKDAFVPLPSVVPVFHLDHTLKALEPVWLTNRQIESARQAMTRAHEA
jgi:hypothetical protein